MDNERLLAIKAKAHLTDLNEGEIMLVEWQLGCLGGFHTKLFDLYASADMGNKKKIESAWPMIGEALRRFYNEDGFWQGIEKKCFVGM